MAHKLVRIQAKYRRYPSLLWVSSIEPALKILGSRGLLPLPVIAPRAHWSPLNCLFFFRRQPWFYGWGFNLPRGQALLEKWNLIPEGVDILITHGPPLGKSQLSPPRLAWPADAEGWGVARPVHRDQGSVGPVERNPG